MTSANSWKTFLLRLTVACLALGVTLRVAVARDGVASGAARSYVTVAGTVSGGGVMPGPVGMVFSFHARDPMTGAPVQCDRAVSTVISADGSFSVEVPTDDVAGACPGNLFDGRDVRVDVHLNGESVVSDAAVNPVPYAVHADLAAVATVAASAAPDSGLSLQLATAATAVPAGTIIAFGGSTIPPGWLLCNGSAVDRTGTYAALFSAIGTAWGAGDGMRTFNVPDLRGRFLRGVDLGARRDIDRVTADAGVGTVQENQVQSHSHGVAAGTGADLGPGLGYSTFQYYFRTRVGTLDSDMAGGRETRPVNAAVNYIIRY